MAREKLYGCSPAHRKLLGFSLFATAVADLSDEASLLNVRCDNCFKGADVSGAHSLCVDNSKNCLSLHERRLTARGRTEWKIKVKGWKVRKDRWDISRVNHLLLKDITQKQFPIQLVFLLDIKKENHFTG